MPHGLAGQAQAHGGGAGARGARRLAGVVVADDAYLGGRPPGKPGCGMEIKVPLIAAVGRDGDGFPQNVR